jgi:hypothetical protein
VILFKVTVEDATETFNEIEATGFSLLGKLSEQFAKDHSNFIETCIVKNNCIGLHYKIVKWK